MDLVHTIVCLHVCIYSLKIILQNDAKNPNSN